MSTRKFKNIVCNFGDIKFHSLLERTIYLHIRALLQKHPDFNIFLQYKIEIFPKGQKNSINKRAMSYIADYFICKNSDIHMEKTQLIKSGLILDAKGVSTPLFCNKISILSHMHDIDVHVVKNVQQAIALVLQYIDRRCNEDKSI